MPRKHKDSSNFTTGRKRSYRSYDGKVLLKAIALIQAKKISINSASKKFGLPKGTLINKIHNKHTKSVGSPLVLSNTEENVIVEHIAIVSDWGFPFTKNDLRYLVKHYLDKCDRKVLQFNDNLPTRQWAARFLQRHEKAISEKKCQNLKRNKAQLKADDLKLYFDNLKETFTQEDGTLIPPHRIFNYDETNLSDDPGQAKCIFKRGTKYPERIMDHSKSSISVMYCGSASGELLPPYVVYKAANLYPTWLAGGPPHTRYNRSKSGWFDGVIFKDWFISMFLPYVKKHKLNEEGKVVLMGDNLSSHFSSEVLQLCRDNNIAFVCVPKNATHMTQPLDVAFYRPLKVFWRALLEKWKMKQRKSQTVTKEKFPGLLNELHEKLVDENNKSKNLISGFKKCGVHPFDPNQIISRLPESKANVDKTEYVSETVVEMLKELRCENQTKPKQRRTKISVEPGKSVEFEDLEELAEQERRNAELKKTEKKAGTKRKGKVNKTKDSKIDNSESSEDDTDEREKRTVKKRKTRKPEKKNKIPETDDCCVAVLKGKARGRKSKVNQTKDLKIDGSESSEDEIDKVDGVKITLNKRKTRKSSTKKPERKKKTTKNEDCCDTVSKRKAIRPKNRIDGINSSAKGMINNVVADSSSGEYSRDESDGGDIETTIDHQTRPSTSDIHLGDYVIVEFLIPQNTKYFIGMVTNVTKDVLHVKFLIKNGLKFVNTSPNNVNLILPTQVVKVLHTPPLENKQGGLIFQKEEIQGFHFD